MDYGTTTPDQIALQQAFIRFAKERYAAVSLSIFDNTLVGDCPWCFKKSCFYVSLVNRERFIWGYCHACKESSRVHCLDDSGIPCKKKSEIWRFYRKHVELCQVTHIRDDLTELLGISREKESPIHKFLLRETMGYTPNFREFYSEIRSRNQRARLSTDTPSFYKIRAEYPALFFPLQSVPGYIQGFQVLFVDGLYRFILSNSTDPDPLRIFLNMTTQKGAGWLHYKDLLSTIQKHSQDILSGALQHNITCGSINKARRDLRSVAGGFPSLMELNLKHIMQR